MQQLKKIYPEKINLFKTVNPFDENRFSEVSALGAISYGQLKNKANDFESFFLALAKLTGVTGTAVLFI